MIGDGCKAIIVSAVNGPSLDSGLEKALKKGVPIFTCDRLIMENEAVSYYVTFDSYHSPFKPFGSYPYRRAVLAIQARGEHCSPVGWFSRNGEWSPSTATRPAWYSVNT